LHGTSNIFYPLVQFQKRWQKHWTTILVAKLGDI
jgi:hypothetical protein